MFNTLGFHEFIGGCSQVHRVMFSTSGDIMTDVEGLMDKSHLMYIENSYIFTISPPPPPHESLYPPNAQTTT